MDSFSFFVPGEPVTEGSTKAFASGQRVVVTHDRGRELDAWRLKVARAIGDARAPYKRPGILRDDSRIVAWHAIKLYADDTHPAGVTVRVSKARDYLTGQVISSVDDIHNLPVDAVIVDAYGNPFHLYLGDWVLVGREGEYTYRAHEIDLPATLVLLEEA